MLGHFLGCQGNFIHRLPGRRTYNRYNQFRDCIIEKGRDKNFVSITISQCIIHAFPKVEESLRNIKFNTDDEIMTAVEEFFYDQESGIFFKMVEIC